MITIIDREIISKKRHLKESYSKKTFNEVLALKMQRLDVKRGVFDPSLKILFLQYKKDRPNPRAEQRREYKNAIRSQKEKYGGVAFSLSKLPFFVPLSNNGILVHIVRAHYHVQHNNPGWGVGDLLDWESDICIDDYCQCASIEPIPDDEMPLKVGEG